MPRGGYRPGSGRKKGAKDRAPRKGMEAQKIKEMLSFDMKAKARFYQEYLVRVANKSGKEKPLSLAEKRMMNKLSVELKAELTDEKVKVEVTNLDPLEYMLKVMNDPKVDDRTRLTAASLAAPYVHPRKGEGAGKKQDKEERAKAAGKGKFAPSAPPIKLVK